MTAKELYKLLDNAGIEFDIVEIFEGARIVNIKVTEDESLEIEE